MLFLLGYCCVLCRVCVPTLLQKWYQQKDRFFFSFILLGASCSSLDYKRQQEEWRHRSVDSATHLAGAGRGPSRSLTWMWEAYWCFRILVTLCWILTILDLYPKYRQRQSIIVIWPINDHYVTIVLFWK